MATPKSNMAGQLAATQKALCAGILLYGTVFVAKHYQEKYMVITSTLFLLEQAITLTGWIFVFGFVLLRSMSQNLALARNFAFILVLLHPFIHYVGEKGTILDSFLHISFSVLGVHNSILRRKNFFVGTIFLFVCVVWNIRQQEVYTEESYTKWGIYMMRMPLSTFILTWDGITAPPATVVAFAFGDDADTASDQRVTAGVWASWVGAFIFSVVYMISIDGPLYGWIATYGCFGEFITCLSMLHVVQFVQANTLEPKNGVTEGATRTLKNTLIAPIIDVPW